eukprot:TRINITY_DN1503_c0_g1_i1.p1 TRINITY_DN1503_c0_g1~~TRINITY_DN1503_c0_g1_i1.p1  ORF type:complete len:577 (-),score=89.76 TRINITY_DN1503_c0_g1_i1:43-1773(-)
MAPTPAAARVLSVRPVEEGAIHDPMVDMLDASGPFGAALREAHERITHAHSAVVSTLEAELQHMRHENTRLRTRLGELEAAAAGAAITSPTASCASPDGPAGGVGLSGALQSTADAGGTAAAALAAASGPTIRIEERSPVSSGKATPSGPQCSDIEDDADYSTIAGSSGLAAPLGERRYSLRSGDGAALFAPANESSVKMHDETPAVHANDSAPYAFSQSSFGEGRKPSNSSIVGKEILGTSGSGSLTTAMTASATSLTSSGYNLAAPTQPYGVTMGTKDAERQDVASNNDAIGDHGPSSFHSYRSDVDVSMGNTDVDVAAYMSPGLQMSSSLHRNGEQQASFHSSRSPSQAGYGAVESGNDTYETDGGLDRELEAVLAYNGWTHLDVERIDEERWTISGVVALLCLDASLPQADYRAGPGGRSRSRSRILASSDGGATWESFEDHVRRRRLQKVVRTAPIVTGTLEYTPESAGAEGALPQGGSLSLPANRGPLSLKELASLSSASAANRTNSASLAALGGGVATSRGMGAAAPTYQSRSLHLPPGSASMAGGGGISAHRAHLAPASSWSTRFRTS